MRVYIQKMHIPITRRSNSNLAKPSTPTSTSENPTTRAKWKPECKSGISVFFNGMKRRPAVTQARPMYAVAAVKGESKMKWRVVIAKAMHTPMSIPVQPAQKDLPLNLNSCPRNSAQCG